MGVAEALQPELLAEPDLARGGTQKIIASDDFCDALSIVVDDDREVVAEGSVVAP